MQKLLIALSKILDRLIKKPEPVVEEREFFHGKAVGAFANQFDDNLDYYIHSVYDEETDYYIKIQYMCSCSEPVFNLLTNEYFGCDHCDSVCEETLCELCYNLMSVDFGDPNAKL